MHINDLLMLGVKHRASDIHFLPKRPPLLRIDGELVPIPTIRPLTAEETKYIVYGLLTPEQQQVFETQKEMDLAISVPDIGNFRVNLLHQLHGISAVLRIVPERVPTFEELGLPSVLKSLLILSNGLILVTGATGSGKSTTLAAMIEYINCMRACHIITIEDPIEYIYECKKSAINQRQILRDTMSPATALRAALRQDPDVILLGELRDLETIRLALVAAETGHLVMATLHASSAPVAISRIIDAFPSAERARVRNLLSETLQAVICQTLVKRIDGGRVGAFEIMLATPAIRHLIRQDKIAHMHMTIQTNGDIGMCTMEQYLHDLVAKHIISMATARSVSLHRGGSK